jgi:hypothetical protein
MENNIVFDYYTLISKLWNSFSEEPLTDRQIEYISNLLGQLSNYTDDFYQIQEMQVSKYDGIEIIGYLKELNYVIEELKMQKKLQTNPYNALLGHKIVNRPKIADFIEFDIFEHLYQVYQEWKNDI